MTQILVHIPDRNVRVPMRTLTHAEIQMSEQAVTAAVATPVEYKIERVENELRIRDVDLGARLGFARTADIRKLIERHAENLRKISVLATVAQTSGDQGGRPSKSYYLNRKQAIFITAKSETEEATDITIEIIEKFDAYERGAVTPAPQTREQTIAAALLLADQTMKEQAQQIATLAPKAEALDRIASADGALSVTEAAKALQVRPKDLFEFLSTNGWTYRRPGSGTWLGYQTRTNAGDLQHLVMTVLQADGTERVIEQVKVTARGLAKLAKLMPSRTALV